MKGLIGRKVGMTQVYDEKGVLIPVTVVQAGPCVVTDVKTVERDGYSAVQLGFGERKAKNVTKARAGHLAKAGVTGDKLPSVLREIRTAAGDEAPAPGTVLNADVFEANDYLDVVGTTKGRGFQGLCAVTASAAAARATAVSGPGVPVPSAAANGRAT